jgi:hypothetical protein
MSDEQDSTQESKGKVGPEEVKTPPSEPDHDLSTRCNFVLRRGKRKGLYCTRKQCANSDKYCNTHCVFIRMAEIKKGIDKPHKKTVDETADEVKARGNSREPRTKKVKKVKEESESDKGESDSESLEGTEDEGELQFVESESDEGTEREDEGNEREEELSDESESDNEREEYVIKRKPQKASSQKVRPVKKVKEPKPPKMTKKEEKAQRMQEKSQMISRHRDTGSSSNSDIFGNRFGMTWLNPDVKIVSDPQKELRKAVRNLRY